jgi:hypothetical protein
LLEFPDTKDIYFDITPKPPATIEYVWNILIDNRIKKENYVEA